jgi:hypothetical protein
MSKIYKYSAFCGCGKVWVSLDYLYQCPQSNLSVQIDLSHFVDNVGRVIFKSPERKASAKTS